MTPNPKAQAGEGRPEVIRAAERWRRKMDTAGPHWPWPGAKTVDGQGTARVVVGNKSMTLRASHVIWEAEHGPVPAGLILRRICPQAGCVRPGCHELQTRSELGRSSGSPFGENGRKTRCLNGHPFSGPESDTYTYPDGARECRTCRRAGQRKAYSDRVGERTAGPRPSHPTGKITR